MLKSFQSHVDVEITPKNTILATGLMRFQKRRSHNQSVLVSYVFLGGFCGDEQKAYQKKHGILVVFAKVLYLKYDRNVLGSAYIYI